ncbi:MAG: RHS repeat-associated core domain-containing protein, partial [Chloroflexales bacterium]|nr:RHS repeat-associated core domain-containing protein [Chloroflexales bacterium]
FTGELQDDGDSGLVYLRARWYDPGSGTLTTRDPFAGCPKTPYSLHPYQYAYANPVVHVDPSGECVVSLAYWEVYAGYHHIDVWVNECGPLPDHESRCTANPETTLQVFEGHPLGKEGNIVENFFECLDLWDTYGRLWGESFSYEEKNRRHDGHYLPAPDLALAMTDMHVARQRGDILTIVADDQPCTVYTTKMEKFIERLQTVKINDNPVFRNSNGVAYALVEAAGLPHPQKHLQTVIGYNDKVYQLVTDPPGIPFAP